ncbi:MAG: L-histidine N(alpha)-methyltransferase [Alphaproteobacteria bacterium]|nr:L-histidine N(alpha)-methyltransferase [Alphaproteobacteria bacterium]
MSEVARWSQRSVDPWLLYAQQAREGFQKTPPEVPMLVGYGVPSYSLSTPENISIKDALLRFGPVPIMVHGQLVYLKSRNERVPAGASLLSGAQQFDMCIASRDGYYIRQADHLILEDPEHGRYLAGCIKDAIVVELCIGSGEKSKRLLTQARQLGSKPTRYVINDMVRDSLNAAKKAICDVYPVERVRPVLADVFHTEFDATLRDAIGNSSAPIVVLLQGGTIGNFTKDETDVLLDLLRNALKPGDKLIVSADSTRHLKTLKRAYDRSADKQFFVGAFVFACHIAGLDGLNQDAIDCKIDFSLKTKDQIEVKIINTEPQHLGPRSGPSVSLLPGSLRAGLMCKRNPKGWAKKFKQHAFHLTRVMPARIPKKVQETHPALKKMFRHVQHNYLVFELR